MKTNRRSRTAKLRNLVRLLTPTSKPRRQSRRPRRSIEQLESRNLLAAVTLLDINTQQVGSNPVELTVVGDDVFFAAKDGVHGLELWKTDGTESGTVLVKNSNEGSSRSLENYSRNNFEDVDGTLFFAAFDQDHGRELWKSDGTTAGTVLVKDIFAGVQSSDITNLTSHNGSLFFFADGGTNGVELWMSDGSEAGTVMVKDINPAGGQNSLSNEAMVSFGDVLLFGADDGVSGIELWSTDGTEAGTTMVTDVRPGQTSGVFGDFIVSGSSAFFRGNNGDSGTELFRTDGTEAGTVLLEVKTGPTSSNPNAQTDVNGTLFFSADGDTGDELYKTDGTVAGTELVKEINPTGNGVEFSVFAAVGDRLFFEADDGSTGRELWVSDGTDAGTQLVKEINPEFGTTGQPRGAGITFIQDVGGVAFFGAEDGTNGIELWKSDGTEAGTTIVRDINPEPGASGIDFFARTPVTLGNELIFPADQGSGRELWKSDGSLTGTIQVKDIDTISTGSSDPVLYPGAADLLNGELFFRASDGLGGSELFKTDGTRTGTTKVRDINPDGDSFLRGVTTVGDAIFFQARDGTTGGELWTSDGTEAGTQLVKDIPSGEFGSYPAGITNVDGKVFFTARTEANGSELWTSDGTEAGTNIVVDLQPGSGSGASISSSGFTSLAFGGELYFSGDDGSTGSELWKSDGTAAGTTLVKDIGPGDSRPRRFIEFAGSLFFTADGPEGRELWKTDGTTDGTVIVKDINGDASDSIGTFDNFFITNDQLFFLADDGVNGQELWKTDGTEAGTTLVRNINPVGGSSSPRFGGVLNDVLFFTANDGTHGRELWKSDGSEAGTELVKDIFPGVTDGTGFFGGFSPQAFDGKLYFAANDGQTGTELWETDGTADGTVLVEDIFVGRDSSYPNSFQEVDGRVVFVAGGEGGFTAPGGRELYRLGVDPASVTAEMSDALTGDVNSDGNTDPGDTITYTVDLAVGAEADADTVTYAGSLDANTTIVPGSVSTSQGTITTGSNGGTELFIGIGTIPASGTVTISYSIVVNDPLPDGVTMVSNQGTVVGNNFADELTDDPALAGTSDPTSTAVEGDVVTGAAPVATDFPVGTIPLGTLLTVDATDIISDFGTDADSVLTSMSVTFGMVEVDGLAVGGLADVGFTYTPGAGPSGVFLIDTGASAFASLAAGATSNVVIDFTVSDGVLTDAGELTFAVSGDAGDFDTAAFLFLGETVLDQDVKALTEAGISESLLEIALTGASDVSDAIGLVDLTVAKADNPFESLLANMMLTVAVATSADGGTADATASDGSQAKASAEGESTAVATASDSSVANATASGDSVASAEASVRSNSVALATDSSASSATASDDSEANAVANSGSAGDATASDNSDATATADETSNATATASDESESIADASAIASATAFSRVLSQSDSIASGGSISTAVALDESSANATAMTGSDALASAIKTSTASANASDESSASAAADTVSTADALAANASTAVAFAASSSVATGDADVNSVAIGLAFDDTTVTATAKDDSAARAAGTFDSIATATATNTSAVDASANAAESTSESPGVDTGDDFADAVQNKIGQITSDVTIGKAVSADYTMNAITGGTDPTLEQAINGLIDREAGDPVLAASESTATADDHSLSVTTANDGSDSVAVGKQRSMAAAFASSSSESTVDATDDSIGNAVAITNSNAKVDSLDGSDALSCAEEGSTAEAIADGNSSASSSAGDTSNAKATATVASTSTSSSTGNSSATTQAENESVASAEADDASTALSTAKVDSASSATASANSEATAVSENASATAATATNFNNASSQANNGRSSLANAFDTSVSEVTIIAAAGTSGNVTVRTPATVLTGPKDTTLAFPFSIQEIDGAIVTSVVLTGLPVGSVLSSGIPNADGTEWTFTETPTNLTFTPPTNFGGEFVVEVSATSSDDDLASASQRVAIENDGFAPVAKDFPVGTIPLGTTLSIDAKDIISDFGTDADSTLTSMSVMFTTVEVGGSAVDGLADVGFTYSAGADASGEFTVDTNASAFSSLVAGQNIDVVIDFTVSDGVLSDSGELTFSVTGDAGIAQNIAFHFLGDTVVDQEVKASAEVGVGESVLEVSLAGASDVSDTLQSVDFVDPLGLDPLFENQILTVAAALAAEDADATATATNGSQARASATSTSSATATAKNDSVSTAVAANESTASAKAENIGSAQAAANGGSVSNAVAEQGSLATAVADGNSAASADAKNTSDAQALAEASSAADADASDISSATATSDNQSVATANATDDSTAVASASQTGSATAVAETSSVSSADTTMVSISTAFSIDNSSSSASSSRTSEAIAVSTLGSTSEASATDETSATATADAGRSATARAFDSSVSQVTITAASTTNQNIRVIAPATILTAPKDTSLAIPFSVQELDGALVTSVKVTGLPVGSALSSGTPNVDGTEWSFSAIPESLTLTPPAGFSGEFGVNIFATSSDSDEASASQRVLVTSDDQPDEPVITIDDARIAEGNDGQKILVATVRRNTNVGNLSVPFSTRNGTAVAGQDFEAVSGTIEFVDGGAFVASITIPITGDTLAESDETFQVVLGSVVGVTIADSEATVTIENDDVDAPTGDCLSAGLLTVGANEFSYTCATPGGFVAFVGGTENGSRLFSKYDANVNIADAEVLAIGVADLQGHARAIVNLTAEQLQDRQLFQAFRMVPQSGGSGPQVSNLISSQSILDVSGEGDVTMLDLLMVLDELSRQASPSSGESASDESRAARNHDVNRDQEVTPLDALVLINHLADEHWGDSVASSQSELPVSQSFETLDDDLLMLLAEDDIRLQAASNIF